MTKLNLLADKIIEEYKLGYGSVAISKRNDCCNTTVLNILRKNNIPIKKSGRIKGFISHLKGIKYSNEHNRKLARLNLPEQDIVKEYKDGAKLLALAKKYDCSVQAVLTRLNLNNILRRKGGTPLGWVSPRKGKTLSQDQKRNLLRINLPEQEIVKEYINGKNATELSNKYNCSVQSILTRLRLSNIPVRKGGFQKGDTSRLGFKGPLSSRKGKSYDEIYGPERAQKLIEKRLQTIKNNGGLIGPMKGKKHSEYSIQKMKDIHQKLFLDGKVKTAFITGQTAGENSYNWQGGISFEKYTQDFNNQLKNQIRKRDNQICMNCGIHREKLKEALNIHHINYDKKLCIEQNLISLCSPCHGLTNMNRNHWTKFFQSLLAERYGYKYSGDGKVIIELELNKEMEVQK